MTPNRIFFTGAPGSHWSAISQDIEILPGFNNSDQHSNRKYTPDNYAGHRGAYFGQGMEFTADIEKMDTGYRLSYIDSPWDVTEGTKIIKSHEWAHKLQFIKDTFPTDWIMLVYRPDLQAQAWWHEAGGFSKISYPDYSFYKDSATMLSAIMQQNQAMLKFAYEQNATWKHYTPQWIKETFGYDMAPSLKKHDILVTVIK